MAYDAIEPIGDDRADLRAAMLAWVTTEVQRSAESKKDHPLRIDDFLIVGEKRKKDEGESEDEKRTQFEGMKAMVMTLAESMGGIIVEEEQ